MGKAEGYRFTKVVFTFITFTQVIVSSKRHSATQKGKTQHTMDDKSQVVNVLPVVPIVGYNDTTSQGANLSDTDSLQSSGHGASPPPPPLAQGEDKAVTWSKALVCFVLCVATTVFAMTTFRYTKKQEEQDFQIRVS